MSATAVPTSAGAICHPPTETEHLTLTETAEWLRCSTRTLQRLLETGEGPPVIRLSQRRLIFRLSDVRQWVEGRTSGIPDISEARSRRARRLRASAGARS
jgi:predicted DNA-binding transcriptional regulator AlpA